MPWAAALDPGSIAIDAALGGLLGSGGAYVDDLLRPGAGAIDDVVRPGAGGIVDDAIRGACSFSAETRVLMADGSTKPISGVRVGDWVMATDPETGESGPREVVAELPHTDELLELETSAGEIVTTEDHRYWNETDGEWQEAQDLDAGDRLRTADGDIVTVEGLDWTTVHTAPAYDLTIAAVHTFYVLAGTEAVLVHNCNPSGTGQRIYRAVEPDELADLVGSGQYRNIPGIGHGKYFFPTRQQADAFAEMMTKRGMGGPYCTTSGCIPADLLRQIERITPAGEGAAYYIPDSLLPYIDDILTHGG